MQEHNYVVQLVHIPPSTGSSLLVRRPCLELLCTNMLSDTANNGPSILGVVAMATCNIATKQRNCDVKLSSAM